MYCRKRYAVICAGDVYAVAVWGGHGCGKRWEKKRKSSFIYFCHFGLAVRDGAKKNLEMAK